GKSNWVSAALTFFDVFYIGLRQFASTRSWLLAAGGNFGGYSAPLHSRPRNSGMPQNQLHPPLTLGDIPRFFCSPRSSQSRASRKIDLWARKTYSNLFSMSLLCCSRSNSIGGFCS